jgi:hypothetical protein
MEQQRQQQWQQQRQQHRIHYCILKGIRALAHYTRSVSNGWNRGDNSNSSSSSNSGGAVRLLIQQELEREDHQCPIDQRSLQYLVDYLEDDNAQEQQLRRRLRSNDDDVDDDDDSSAED